MNETIVRLAARGDGVTEGGRYVPGTAPGDTFEADGSIIPGPHRRVPPCRHFGTCGGCQLQHIDDAAYAEFIVARIGSALAEQRIGDVPIGNPHLSPPHARRRASLRVERRGRDVVLGFNEGASNRVFALRECHVLRSDLVALLKPLRVLCADVLAERARGEIVLTAADQGIDLLLAVPVIEGYEAIERLSAFAREHALARLAVDSGEGVQDLWLPQPPTIALSGVPVALPHQAFLQATADGEATLCEAVRAHIGGAARVADLFAGLGTFALGLPNAKLAVEGSRAAALALLATRRVQVMHRDLFRRPLSAEELSSFDAVVLDPPRAGAAAQVGELARSKVERIAYVSCNPSTFARDARTLIDGGYRLASIKPVGQFRWSTHVELAAAFTR